MGTEPLFRVAEIAWTDGAQMLRAVRYRVFVEEQGVAEALEWDGLDAQCRHVLARCRNGVPIGTGRLLPDGHIGRMAVLPDWRRSGIGRALLRELLRIARARGDDVAILHAQTHAIEFYRREQFEVTSAEFMEADIPHVEMRLKLFPG